MKAARERAIDIAYRIIGPEKFTRGCFLRVLEDEAEAGESARKLVREIERGIELDRHEIAKAQAPS